MPRRSIATAARRSVLARRPGRRHRPIALLAAAAALAIVPFSGVVAGQPLAAQAEPLTASAPVVATAPAASLARTDYPTWDDVRAAQANETAAKQQIAAIQATLAQLQADVAATQAVAEEKGADYQAKQSAYDTQAYKTQQLQDQADAAQAEADSSKKAAAQLIAELSKTGGSNDMTANLIGHAGAADNLLYRLGAMSKLTERSDQIYARALQQQQTAQSLTDEATVAKQKLEELRVVAEAAFQEAQTAAVAAQQKYTEQEDHAAQLQAQLAVLTEKREATEADFQAGIKAQWGDGAEGEISSSGWARPVPGYITSAYGGRYHPITGAWIFHEGVDIGGNACGSVMRAVHGGTVVYAGPYGGYGNYIRIDHGDGTTSAYGHIQNGGIKVGIGQTVSPGQPIALVGSTGNSTGCHLHLEIRVNGNTVDPIPYLRDRGITIS